MNLSSKTNVNTVGSYGATVSKDKFENYESCKISCEAIDKVIEVKNVANCNENVNKVEKDSFSAESLDCNKKAGVTDYKESYNSSQECINNFGDENKPDSFKQVVAALTACMAHFFIIAFTALPGVVLPALTDPLSHDLVLDQQQAALFSSVVYFGAMIGSLLSGPIAVYLGQKVTLMIAFPLGATSWILLAVTPTVWILQVARFVQGFSAGLYGSTGATYVAEICHSSIRGRLSGCLCLFQQFGYLFICILATTGMGLRSISSVCAGVSMLPFVILCFLPNSPRWLATKTRYDEAKKSLTFFRGKKYNVNLELDNIVKELTDSTRQTISIRNQFALLTDISILKRLLLLSSILFVFVFSGFTPLVVFSAYFFQSFSSNVDSNLFSVIIGFFRISAVSSYLIFADKISRRKQFMYSHVISTVCLALFTTVSFVTNNGVEVSSVDWLMYIALAGFVFFSCITQSTIIVLRGELLPTCFRSLGVAIVFIVMFLGCFLSSYFFLMMIDTLGIDGTFLIYTIMRLSLIIVGGCCIPNTNAKSLEHIEEMYKLKDNLDK